MTGGSRPSRGLPRAGRYLSIVRLGVKSLMLHKLRSGLTMLGIIFGVCSVIVMLAIGEGASYEAQEAIKKLGSNNIILRSLKPPEEAPDAGGGSRRSFELVYGLTYADGARIQETIPGVRRVLPVRVVREKRPLRRVRGALPGRRHHPALPAHNRGRGGPRTLHQPHRPEAPAERLHPDRGAGPPPLPLPGSPDPVGQGGRGLLPGGGAGARDRRRGPAPPEGGDGGRAPRQQRLHPPLHPPLAHGGADPQAPLQRLRDGGRAGGAARDRGPDGGSGVGGGGRSPDPLPAGPLPRPGRLRDSSFPCSSCGRPSAPSASSTSSWAPSPPSRCWWAASGS